MMSRDENETNNSIPSERRPGVLVVDDNPLIVDVVRGLLTSQRYRVFTSRNGKEALEVLGTERIDVVICDVMMPKMGGYELHQVIRNNPDSAHIPFIFLTALDDQRDVEMGKEAGADDYLCKPFEPRELLAVVKGKVTRSQSLREMNEKRYDTYRRKVIHTLSHEFRTPLVAINTGMELLLDQGIALGDTKARGLLDAVRRGGQRLERLVNDFMVLQQLDAGITKRVFEARAVPMTVSTLLQRYMEVKGEPYVAQGAVIDIRNECEGASVKVVENHMLDCLDRLISNAIKFSKSNEPVEIRAYCVNGEVIIDVMDRGMGLDPAKIEEALGLFGQIGREQMEQQGSGLGLPIASGYIALSGGRLEFEPRRGGGAIMSIVLPAVSP